jgi:hypothetical protein
MNKIKKSYPVFLLLMLFLHPGCTEYIDLDLETTARRLVVDGSISSERQIHFLRLSESVPFLTDSLSPPVSGAQVFISNGYSRERLAEATEMPGFYLLENGFVANPGNYYELTISGVDIDNDGEQESYRAVSYMPEVVGPDSVDLVYDPQWEIWKVLLYADDPPETEDYYMFRVLINGVLVSDNISEYNVVSDRFFDDGRAEGVWVQSINANSEAEPLKEGDVVSLQMCGVTEAYFDFVQGVQREGRGQYPLFSGPPANAPGNISNGGLGFFTAFSISYANFVVTADLVDGI